jgi:hypothetical protein
VVQVVEGLFSKWGPEFKPRTFPPKKSLTIFVWTNSGLPVWLPLSIILPNLRSIWLSLACSYSVIRLESSKFVLILILLTLCPLHFLINFRTSLSSSTKQLAEIFVILYDISLNLSIWKELVNYFSQCIYSQQCFTVFSV